MARPVRQVQTSQSIGFLEDDDEAPSADQAKGSEGAEGTPARSQEGDRANQVAAARAIAAFRVEDARQSFPTPIVASISEADAAALLPKVYRVTAPAEIRKGAASYKLPVGKVIDARQYDVAALRQQGVQLEEIERS